MSPNNKHDEFADRLTYVMYQPNKLAVNVLNKIIL